MGDSKIIQEANLKGNIRSSLDLRGSIHHPVVVREENVPDTYILVDEEGNEFAAVLTDDLVTLTADVNDIREGKTAVSTDGVVVGEKFIPSYITREGTVYIESGNEMRIKFYSDQCQYTKLQVLVCAYNGSLADSVSTSIVSINGKVYPVNSDEYLSEVSVDLSDQTIDLNLSNDSGIPVVIRFFTYKEVY